MKRIKSIIIAAVIILALSFAGIVPAIAATDNPSPASTGYETWVFHVSGTMTSTVTPIKFKAPWPYRALSVSVYARSVSGASTVASQTVDIKQGSTSLVSTPIQIVDSDTVTAGTLKTSPAIADEATVSIILTLTGSGPAVTDLTVVMPVKRQ